MVAPVGNQFWKARAKSGRKKIFETPDNLWEAACEYFQWVEDNPLSEEKLFAYQGTVTKDTIQIMRAMTIEGLCLFLGISRQTWSDYKARQDFVEITEQIENVIRQQKFAGAAANLLNANIIARDLGLTEKQELTGADGTDLIPATITVKYE